MKKSFMSFVCAFSAAASLLIFSQNPIGYSSTLNILQHQDANPVNFQLKQAKDYPSDVVFKWMDMQLRLMRTSSPFIGGLPVTRLVGYTGITLYESVVPGMPACQSLSGQLNQFPKMPASETGLAYYWPGSANAALATITRCFFHSATQDNKRAVDSLENALNNEYRIIVGEPAVLQRSIAFGKSVAQKVFDWSRTDGADHANDHYTPPVGVGLWEPLMTSKGPQVAFGPYWKNNRLLVAGSLNNTAVAPLPAYSIDPSSDFYKMVKEVYDVSHSLTPEQKAMALYYRDNPGFGDGHYISILKLVLQRENSTLDESAMAYAKAGIALVDAGIGCWKVKYTYNNMRPILYIRNVLGHRSWTPLFDTPPFPDYTSGHSTLAGAMAVVLTSMFGDNYHLTNNTYRYLGMPDQHYASFYDMADQIGMSRVYAGIHYTVSCTEGNKMGQKVAQNILKILKFEKDPQKRSDASINLAGFKSSNSGR